MLTGRRRRLFGWWTLHSWPGKRLRRCCCCYCRCCCCRCRCCCWLLFFYSCCTTEHMKNLHSAQNLETKLEIPTKIANQKKIWAKTEKNDFQQFSTQFQHFNNFNIFVNCIFNIHICIGNVDFNRFSTSIFNMFSTVIFNTISTQFQQAFFTDSICFWFGASLCSIFLFAQRCFTHDDQLHTWCSSKNKKK